MFKTSLKQLKAIPKWTKIGVLGVVLMYVSVASTLSLALPWWIGKGDSALHVDYALSVYNGDIPSYRDYVQYPIFHQLDKGYKTQIQRAAANPPLFYVLHAPIVGPLLESGHWKPAIALGRAFNIFLGILVVLSLAWAGWLFGGKRKELLAVAVPAIGAMSYQFTNLNQNYALDVLLMLLGVLTSVVWYKLIKHGPQKRYLVAVFLLSILGMSTKATYIVFLGISLLAVTYSYFISSKENRFKGFLKGSFVSGLILTSVLICIGWFYYYWNYKTSGKWYTGELPGDFGSRPYKSLPTVLTHSGLWANFYARFTANADLSKIISIAALAGVALAAVRTKLRGLTKDKTLFVGTILLAFLLVGTTGTQITHAWGIGNFSFRYFLPAILVFGLFVSYGLLEIKRARGQLITAAIIGMAATSVITIANLDNIKSWVPEVGATSSIYQKLQIAMASNGFPGIVLIVLFVMLLIGIPLTGIALFKLSGPVKPK